MTDSWEGWRVTAGDNDVDLFCPRCGAFIRLDEWDPVNRLLGLIEEHVKETHEDSNTG